MLAWGGTQVHQAAAFVQELELPVELDQLEGGTRAEPATSSAISVFVCSDEWVQQVRRRSPLLLGQVVELVQAVLSLGLPGHAGGERASLAVP